MVRKAKLKIRQGARLKPTSAPTGEDVALAGIAALDIVQRTILSPAAVISSLTFALEVYVQNVIDKGFDPKLVDECKAVGTKIASVFMNEEDGAEAQPKAGGLVGPDGAPL